jgi:hypothetical protein
MSMIRIPSSASRSYKGEGCVWAKLLKRVDPRASDGFGFEGKYFKCGSFVDAEALWPTPDYPITPILLESAGITGFTEKGERARGNARRSEVLFILWRFNLKTREWEEIARAKSDSATWAVEFTPIAMRAIQPPLPAIPANTPDLRLLSEQMCNYTLTQLERLPPEQRPIIVAALHDQLAVWLSEAGGAPVIPFPITASIQARHLAIEAQQALAPAAPVATQSVRKCPICSASHASVSGNWVCDECLRFLRRPDDTIGSAHAENSQPAKVSRKAPTEKKKAVG